MTTLAVDARWAQRLCIVATLGFLMSLAVHVATLLGFDLLPRFKPVLVLHVGVFLVFIPFVVDVRRFRNAGWRRLLGAVPGWAYFMAVAAFLYAWLNFYTTVRPGGSASRPLPDLTMLRAFSGHWLLFYLLPALYFGVVLKDTGARGHEAA